MVRREGQADQPPVPFHMVTLYLLGESSNRGMGRRNNVVLVRATVNAESPPDDFDHPSMKKSSSC